MNTIRPLLETAYRTAEDESNAERISSLYLEGQTDDHIAVVTATYSDMPTLSSIGTLQLLFTEEYDEEQLHQWARQFTEPLSLRLTVRDPVEGSRYMERQVWPHRSPYATVHYSYAASDGTVQEVFDPACDEEQIETDHATFLNRTTGTALDTGLDTLINYYLCYRENGAAVVWECGTPTQWCQLQTDGPYNAAYHRIIVDTELSGLRRWFDVMRPEEDATHVALAFPDNPDAYSWTLKEYYYEERPEIVPEDILPHRLADIPAVFRLIPTALSVKFGCTYTRQAYTHRHIPLQSDPPDNAGR